jgi:hypothetical protein
VLIAKTTIEGGSLSCHLAHPFSAPIRSLRPSVLCAHPFSALTKIVALAGLVLMTTLLSAPAAQAGSWVFTCAGSGSNTLNYGFPFQPPYITVWTPPGPQNGIFNFGKFGGGNDYSVSDVVTISVTVTATWTHGTGQDDTNDPAPPSVWLCESAGSEWTQGSSGSASDGLGDPYTPGNPGGSSTTSVPFAHWKSYGVSGGAVTLATRTLKAEGDFPVTQANPYGNNCFAYIDSYTVTVHPQPYNFYRIPGSSSKGKDGSIGWTYGYSSTDGNTSDLTTCYWHEYLTYQGPIGTLTSPNPYYPPDPPFNYPSPGIYFKNPEVFPGPGKQGNNMAQLPADAIEQDITMVPSFVAPSLYAFGTYTVTQVYQFDDTATGEVNVQVPGPSSGPYTIVRTVNYLDPHDYQYLVTKDSVTNMLLLPN